MAFLSLPDYRGISIQCERGIDMRLAGTRLRQRQIAGVRWRIAETLARFIAYRRRQTAVSERGAAGLAEKAKESGAHLRRSFFEVTPLGPDRIDQPKQFPKH